MSNCYSLAELRQAVERVPRFPLAHLPTPFEFLHRFSKSLGGPRVFLKRDDCTGLAMGGNKTRHNEYLLADALKKGSDTFVWGAGVQSNNCRQTVAACAKAGLDCQLVLGRGRSAGGPDSVQGNLLLDHLMGASYEIVDATIGDELDRVIAAKADEFRAQGRKVYFWNREVVKPLAAVSYVTCLVEIIEQAGALGFTPDALYVSSCGSTGSGLALATKALGVNFPVRNICPLEWEWDTQTDMADIANKAAELMEIDTRLDREDIELTFDFIPPGYGKSSPEGNEALALVARTEGILLDPIYTAKAMAGLISDVRQMRFSEGQNIVFIHTGGTPALFAYSDELATNIAARTLGLRPSCDAN